MIQSLGITGKDIYKKEGFQIKDPDMMKIDLMNML